MNNRVRPGSGKWEIIAYGGYIDVSENIKKYHFLKWIQTKIKIMKKFIYSILILAVGYSCNESKKANSVVEYKET